MTLESRIRDAADDVIEIVPTGRVLGAEVRGVDLTSLDDRQFSALKRAWHQHQVLLIRGQQLRDQDLIAFSRRFGDLDWAPVQETGRRFVEGLPEIYIVSNVKVNGEPIGSLGAGEAVWHTDMSYLDVPPMASMPRLWQISGISVRKFWKKATLWGMVLRSGKTHSGFSILK